MSNIILPNSIEEVLASDAVIEENVARIAREISRDYQGERILLIGILKGSFIFLADLARRLNVAHAVDFMAVSSYGASATASGEVRIIMDLRTFIRDKHVIIVEDIVDTGHTLVYLQRLLEARRPASLRSCVLLSKPSRRQVDVSIDYLGFEIPDRWIVGYGLDFADRFRTLPYIAALKPHVYAPESHDAS